MKKTMKVLLSAIVVFALVTSSMFSVFAQAKGKDGDKHSKQQIVYANLNLSEETFKDVAKDFWGYKAIKELAKRGIINGYSDKSFKPNATVTRSEFATMLTKTLKLTAVNDTQTFVDVKPSSWDFKAVEASKNYLTGYKTSSGTLYFYGTNKAVREDMAVALVKSLKLTVESDISQLPQVFKDSDAISSNLKEYVYTAYKNDLMVGSNGKFAPQANLTRAEAAALLLKALQKVEKVVVDVDDGQKVVVDNEDQTNIKHSDATLSSLTFNGTAIGGFNASTLTYNIVLPTGTTVIPTVAAAVYDTGKATANITQAIALPGFAKVVVTAENGTTQRTYTINFSVTVTPKSTDAALSNLTIDGTTVAGFNTNTLSYNIVLPVGTTTIPTVAATVNATGKATLVLTPAAALPGNTIVLVTAEDGTTKRTYTINFSVTATPKSTDAALSNLTIDGTTVAGFNTNTLSYNIVLPVGTTTIPTVAATVNATGKATLVLTPAAALPGNTTVLVTAEDGTTQKTYTIYFTVSAS